MTVILQTKHSISGQIYYCPLTVAATAKLKQQPASLVYASEAIIKDMLPITRLLTTWPF